MKIVLTKTVTLLLAPLGRPYCKAICRREYESQKRKKKRINERRIEYRFALESLTSTRPTTVLDVGTGTTAFPSLLRTCGFLVTATDNVTDYWPRGMFNRHYYVVDDDITNTRLTDQFDFVTCISVIEHIRDSNDAIRCMFRLLRPGGHMVLTFPYNEHQYLQNVYEHPDASYGQKNPFICQVYSRNELHNWLEQNRGFVVRQEYWEVVTGDFWACGDWLDIPRKVEKEDKHHLSCVLFQKPAAL